jgi:type IV pilus assembly protein PilQ
MVSDMTQLKREATMQNETKVSTRRLLYVGLGLAMMASQLDAASIQALNFTPLPGGEVEVAIKLDGVSDPQIFSTENPARIALDFPDTKLLAKERVINVGTGATKAVTAVEAGNRSRVVIDLFRGSSYTTRLDGQTLVVRVANGFSGELSSARPTAANPLANQLAASGSNLQVKNVDFRRGKQGEGRILVDFTGDGANADLKTEGGKLVVDVYNAKPGQGVDQRMDTTDFATPVQSVLIKPRANGTRIEIEAAGEFEQLAYQAGSQFVVEVAPKKIQEKKRTASDPPVYVGNRATYNFQNLDVRALLQLIADTSEFNIVVADSVRGEVTVRLINVPWDQALDIVLQAKGLDKRRNGNVIYVAPTEEIAKREQAIEDARLALEDRQSLVSDFIPISYGKAEDLARLLTKEALQTSSSTGAQNNSESRGFLSKRGSISFDERTNTLLISDIPARVATIRELIGRLDKPVQQVLIESRIVVANDSYSKELGARFGLTSAVEDRNGNVSNLSGSLGATNQMIRDELNNRRNSSQSSLPLTAPLLGDRLGVNLPAQSATATGFGFSVLANDYLLDLELSALEQEGQGEVISSPRVITASQKEASISQGSAVPYISETPGTNGQITRTVQFRDVLLELKVTPTISPDQRIFMNLQVSQDTVSPVTVLGNPIINTRKVNTAVLVDNGQTVVLGGILERTDRESKDQTPVLGDIPVVGTLFKRKSKVSERLELLVFVTPKILQESLR